MHMRTLNTRSAWAWASLRLIKTLFLSVAFCLGSLSFTPAQAYTLDNCKGFSSSGHLECTTTPQVITAWRYKIPGYIFSTPYFPSEGQALANYKAQWAASIKTCKPITHTLGSFDLEWESVYGHRSTNWDYGQLTLARRKPYTITISDRSDTANGACVLSELKPSHYLYHDRSAACAEGWERSQDDPRSDFCFRFDPDEVSTSCPTDTPTLPGTGVKLLKEDDSVGAGVHPLSFTRHYRSRWPNGVPSDTLPMGAGWTHTYDRSIQIVQGAPTATVRALRGDGSWRTLVRDDSSATATAVTWRDNSLGEPKDRLIQHLNSQGQTLVWGYRPHSDDSLEVYEANGRLRTIKARNGWMTTLVYSTASTPISQAPRAGLLLTVRNHFGRVLRLTYDSAGRIATLTTPDAKVLRYAHDALGNLTAVTAPSADANTPATQYLHYEDSRSLNVHALTGRTDALGVRVATYTYDALGQVASTEKADGLEKLSFKFSSPVGSSSTIYYTPTPGAASTATQYRFSSQAGVLRPTSVTTPCPLCGASAAATSYDANQRRSKVVAHDGRVTFYSYNGWGRVTREATYPASYQSATTLPPLSAAEHVTHTQWHATWNLPLKVAEAYLITSYSYDSKGNLLEMVETPTADAIGAKGFNAIPSGTTYTTRWTYDAKNLPVTIVELEGSTETGRWDMAYNATGDLTGITHVTSGTVATLVPVGNGASQVTDIRISTGSGIAGIQRLRHMLPFFVSDAHANPFLIPLMAFSEAAVGDFLAWCATSAAANAGRSAVVNGIVVASTAVEAARCNFDPSLPQCGLGPNGDCSNQQMKDLQKEKNTACRKPYSCSEKKAAGISMGEVMTRISNGRECAAARQNVMDTCFRGGDPDHKGYLQEILDRINECNALLP